MHTNKDKKEHVLSATSLCKLGVKRIRDFLILRERFKTKVLLHFKKNLNRQTVITYHKRLLRNMFYTYQYSRESYQGMLHLKLGGS